MKKINGVEQEGLGSDNYGITRDYKTIKGFLRYGLPHHYKGVPIKLEVYYDHNNYGKPNQVIHTTIPKD